MLYYQIHGIVYLGYHSISCGVTLLQTWAWEHISISRPVIHVDLQPSEPYAFKYTTSIRHRGSGNTLYWRHHFDILQHFIWRPYLDCPDWHDDVVHLSFC